MPKCEKCQLGTVCRCYNEPQHTTDKYVNMNIELLKERSNNGLQKYGVNLEREDLNPTDWAQHLIEELLDGANYAQVLKDKLHLAIESAFKEGFRMGQEMDTYEPFVFCWR
ncbi:TPA: hypothetical protein NNP44_004646, partial [Salmonella enterica]|nr:hypothetical protein [Salmonella enterica]